MKCKKRQQQVLLGFLLLFSISIHVLYGVRKNGDQQEPFGGMSADQFIAHEGLLIESDSVEALVAQLQRISLDEASEVIKRLFARHDSMTEQDIVEVACGVALYHQSGVDVARIDQFFDEVQQLGDPANRPSMLYSAARSSYPKVLPYLFAWAKKRSNNEAERALDDAVDEQEYAVLSVFDQQGFSFSPELATRLLWRGISLKPKQDDDNLKKIVAFLLARKADPNYAQRGYTMVMKAALANNPEAVRQLVVAGAKVNEIVNNGVGSALQLAIRDKNLAAELALRDLGAVE